MESREEWRIDPDDFTCAICRRTVSMRWNRVGPNECIPPVCRSCEVTYAQGIRKPVAGSYRDRRMVTQGFALAEALRVDAAHKKWGSSFAH